LCVHAVGQWGRCLHCDWKHRYAAAIVLKKLGVVADDLRPEKEAAHQESIVVRLPEDFQLLAHAHDDLDRQARRYILSRGVTPDQVRQRRIGVSYTGRYAYRIIFPIYTGLRLRGFNARDFTGQQQPKYLLSPGPKHLYGFDPKAETVVLSEGVIKALRIAQTTEWGSAALLGRHLTDVQLKQIQDSAAKRIVFYPDAEGVGRRSALAAAEKLAENWAGEIHIVHPVKRPPDDAPLEEISENLHAHLHRWTPRSAVKLAE
jgi:hypothetical protein